MATTHTLLGGSLGRRQLAMRTQARRLAPRCQRSSHRESQSQTFAALFFFCCRWARGFWVHACSLPAVAVCALAFGSQLPSPRSPTIMVRIALACRIALAATDSDLIMTVADRPRAVAGAQRLCQVQVSCAAVPPGTSCRCCCCCLRPSNAYELHCCVQCVPVRCGVPRGAHPGGGVVQRGGADGGRCVLCGSSCIMLAVTFNPSLLAYVARHRVQLCKRADQAGPGVHCRCTRACRCISGASPSPTPWRAAGRYYLGVGRSFFLFPVTEQVLPHVAAALARVLLLTRCSPSCAQNVEFSDGAAPPCASASLVARLT